MKYLISLIVLLSFSCLAIAQSPVGIWKTVDDETNEPKSHVEIYEKDGALYGKVIKLLPKATTDVCIDCPGDKNGKHLYEIDILWDLKPYKDYWSYGKIVDPANGKVYKASMWLEENTLQVRGYIGISLIGRTQVWYKVE